MSVWPSGIRRQSAKLFTGVQFPPQTPWPVGVTDSIFRFERKDPGSNPGPAANYLQLKNLSV